MTELSLVRYKGVVHKSMDRFSHKRLYQKHAKIHLIPMVFLPDGTAMQNSTPILEFLEERHPVPVPNPLSRTDQGGKFRCKALVETRHKRST